MAGRGSTPAPGSSAPHSGWYSVCTKRAKPRAKPGLATKMRLMPATTAGVSRLSWAKCCMMARNSLYCAASLPKTSRTSLQYSFAASRWSSIGASRAGGDGSVSPSDVSLGGRPTGRGG